MLTTFLSNRASLAAAGRRPAYHPSRRHGLPLSPLPTRQYLSAAGALTSVIVLAVFNLFQTVYSPGDYLIVSLSFTTARCCTIFGQLTFADPIGLSCRRTRRRVDSVLRPRPQTTGSVSHLNMTASLS